MFLYDNMSIIFAKTLEAFVTKQHPKIKTDIEHADTLCMLNLLLRM